MFILINNIVQKYLSHCLFLFCFQEAKILFMLLSRSQALLSAIICIGVGVSGDWEVIGDGWSESPVEFIYEQMHSHSLF